jgi:hypothetical protein
MSSLLNDLDQWFIDLAAAETVNMPPGLSKYCDNSLHTFYYTTNANSQPTINSASALRIPTHFGHPADSFRTVVRTISDSHPMGPKNCPTIRRIAVRIKSAPRPN